MFDGGQRQRNCGGHRHLASANYEKAQKGKSLIDGCGVELLGMEETIFFCLLFLRKNYLKRR